MEDRYKMKINSFKNSIRDRVPSKVASYIEERVSYSLIQNIQKRAVIGFSHYFNLRSQIWKINIKK